MAKLLKKVPKLVNESKGRLNKTLVQYNLVTFTENEAKNKGTVFYQSWVGYFDNLYESAVKEDKRRDLLKFLEEKQKEE